MAKTTDLPFDGGAIVDAGGGSASDQVHNVFLRKITVIDSGQESHIYALFDMDKPTSTSPFFEPVSASNLADWCTHGDAIQVDLKEAMNYIGDRYAGILQDVTLSSMPGSGTYVRECTLRTMQKIESAGVRFAWFGLSLIMDQTTSISYLATPVYNNPVMMDVPDHKVQVEQTDTPNYLAYKIMGDGSTVSVDIVRENSLGQPVDPFLRVRTIGQDPVDVIKWSDVLEAEDSDYTEFIERISGDISGGVAPVLLVDGNDRKVLALSSFNGSVAMFSTVPDIRGQYDNYVIRSNSTAIVHPYITIPMRSGVVSISDGFLHPTNNAVSEFEYTGLNPLDFVVSGVPNLAVTIKSTSASDGTVTVYRNIDNLMVPLKPSNAGGVIVEAGKTYQLTAAGDCWTLAEFDEPEADMKLKIGSKLYKVVKIGSLYWMAENLEYNATAETGDLDSASVWYGNDSSTYGDYGKLYCFTETAQEEILAAVPGWRFPTQAEMEALFTESVADLKASTGWTTAGTDGTGFSGVPGGKYFENAFNLYGTQGRWWCVPSDDPLTAANQCYLADDSKGTAFVSVNSYASVRLVKEA